MCSGWKPESTSRLEAGSTQASANIDRHPNSLAEKHFCRLSHLATGFPEFGIFRKTRTAAGE
jgi:hypothetical protein